jgi:hypothetical protein
VIPRAHARRQERRTQRIATTATGRISGWISVARDSGLKIVDSIEIGSLDIGSETRLVA